jgi:nucleotide-binding universal stress UspA family protein
MVFGRRVRPFIPSSTRFMRRILIPLDGTPFGESALPLARRLADRAGAELVLAHVYESPVPISEVLGSELADPGVPVALRQRAQEYLDDVVARTARASRGATESARAGPRVRGSLLDGAPAHAIHTAAQEVEADLVVMASHGRAGLARLLIGSTAESVVHAGGVPVLVVPTSERRLDAEQAHSSTMPDVADAPPPPLRHLLIALDGAPESEAILAPALALARLVESAVTLVGVRDPGDARKTTLLPTAVLDTARSDERVLADEGAPATDPAGYLDQVARRIVADGYRVATHVFEGHPVVDRLLDATRVLAADWLAMSTHGRGFWSRLVEGSVADAVLERVMMPILLVRPDPGRAAGAPRRA